MNRYWACEFQIFIEQRPARQNFMRPRSSADTRLSGESSYRPPARLRERFGPGGSNDEAASSPVCVEVHQLRWRTSD